MKLKTNPCTGFTLLELMIIVGLIGMLAAISVPTLIRARTTSQTNVCRSNLRQIQSALQQWSVEMKKAPTASVATADLTPYLRNANAAVCPAGGTSIDDSYMLVDVATEPTCMKEPVLHILQP